MPINDWLFLSHFDSIIAKELIKIILLLISVSMNIIAWWLHFISLLSEYDADYFQVSLFYFFKIPFSEFSTYAFRYRLSSQYEALKRRRITTIALLFNYSRVLAGCLRR